MNNKKNNNYLENYHSNLHNDLSKIVTVGKNIIKNDNILEHIILAVLRTYMPHVNKLRDTIITPTKYTNPISFEESIQRTIHLNSVLNKTINLIESADDDNSLKQLNIAKKIQEFILTETLKNMRDIIYYIFIEKREFTSLKFNPPIKSKLRLAETLTNKEIGGGIGEILKINSLEMTTSNIKHLLKKLKNDDEKERFQNESNSLSFNVLLSKLINQFQRIIYSQIDTSENITVHGDYRISDGMINMINKIKHLSHSINSTTYISDYKYYNLNLNTYKYKDVRPYKVINTKFYNEFKKLFVVGTTFDTKVASNKSSTNSDLMLLYIDKLNPSDYNSGDDGLHDKINEMKKSVISLLKETYEKENAITKIRNSYSIKKYQDGKFKTIHINSDYLSAKINVIKILNARMN